MYMRVFWNSPAVTHELATTSPYEKSFVIFSRVSKATKTQDVLMSFVTPPF
jgi:hypothetical protein